MGKIMEEELEAPWVDGNILGIVVLASGVQSWQGMIGRIGNRDKCDPVVVEIDPVDMVKVGMDQEA